MDWLSSIVAGFVFLFLIMGAVYLVATSPGIILVIAGILLGIGVLCWPLIQKIL